MRKDVVAKLDRGAVVTAQRGKYGGRYEFRVIDPEPVHLPTARGGHKKKWFVRVECMEAPADDRSWRRPDLSEEVDGLAREIFGMRKWTAGAAVLIECRVIKDVEADTAAAEKRNAEREERRQALLAVNAKRLENKNAAIVSVIEQAGSSLVSSSVSGDRGGHVMRLVLKSPAHVARLLDSVGNPEFVLLLPMNEDGTMKRGDSE